MCSKHCNHQQPVSETTEFLILQPFGFGCEYLSFLPHIILRNIKKKKKHLCLKKTNHKYLLTIYFIYHFLLDFSIYLLF